MRPFHAIGLGLGALAAAGWLSIPGRAGAGNLPPPSPLVVTTTPVALPNPGLLIDDGQKLGFGDATAGNGMPDGWRAGIKQGAVHFSAGATVEKSQVTHVVIDPGTEGSLQSKGEPAAAGQTWVLKTRLNLGDPDPKKQNGSVGIAFMKGPQMLDYALHRLELEYGGWQDIEIRASAPAGTEAAKVRIVISAKDAKEAGSFDLMPFTLDRVEAQSRSRAFPLQHLFLVTVETFRADHSSLFGYARDTTPNLVKIAKEGAVLLNHHPQAPYTRPSLSSLVTSRYPASLGITENLPPLPASATTMAELFADGGYVTGGFVAQYLLSAHFGFNQGFHYFYNHPNDTMVDVVWGDLFPWMEAHKADNSMAWIHLFDPHGPYRPPEDFAHRFEGDATWTADGAQLAAGQGKKTGAFIPGYVADEGELSRRHYVARYDAEIALVDDRLGKLFDWIRAEGMAESSMVIVTADHGESMTDHDRFFCHGSLYDHDLHVPMVVWAPGRVRPGTVVTERTAHLDILPTMLDYAGVKAPSNLKGSSLRGILDGKAKAAQPYTVAVTGQGDTEELAVYSDSPLVFRVNHAGEATAAWNLAADPGQTTDVLAYKKDDVAKMAAAYKTWMAAQLKDDAPAAKPAVKRKISTDEQEMLRQLGYME
jgi:arylsulfatase A-like enzyme